MSMHPDEPAFPVVGVIDKAAAGLTKRQYFAALAMQGLLSDPDRVGNFRSYANDAVACADALIAALNEEPQP